MIQFVIPLILSIATPLPDTAPPTKIHEALKPTIKKAKLENGLTLLVISDPSAEKGAAALSVEAGSWQDPTAHPGMAHFLEHMLFMGTESHPDEDSFGTFIGSRGGQTNAYTEDQFTTYFFETDPGAFPEALALFGEFFSEPLLKSQGAAREMHAVDQEFRGHSQNDDARRLMVYKALGNPKHPFSKFTYGSSETLSKVTGEELREWFKGHYSPSLMTLVLYSPLPADELINQANQIFSKIPASPLTAPTYDERKLMTDLSGKIVYIEPIQNKRSMLLMWELSPKFAHQIETKPDDLLCYVLGHEGENSLLELLKQQGLALGIECGLSKWEGDFVTLLVEIKLTAKGLNEKWKVVEEVFGAIRFLQETPYPATLFDEIKITSQQKYDYPTSDTPFKEVAKHSRLIRQEPIETYPYLTTVIQKFDPQLVQELAKELTPENLQLDILAKGVPVTETELWMRARYSVQEIPADVLASWKNAKPDPSLGYPIANTFIVKQLAVISKDAPQKTAWTIPEEIAPGLYFSADKHYLLPQSYVSFLIKTPEVDVGDPTKVILNELLLKLATHQLQKEAYLSKLAGLSYELGVDDFGIKITVGGFSGNEEKLFGLILNSLQAPPSEELFGVYLEEMEKEYENFPFKPSYEQGADLLKSALYQDYSSQSEKLTAIKKLKYSEFLDHQKSLFAQNELLGAAFGNLTKETVLDTYHFVQAQIKGTPYHDDREQKIAIIPSFEGPFILTKTTESKGNAVLLALEGANRSPKSYAAGEILAELMQTPFFNELRTRQQTAYLLVNLHQELNNLPLSLFILESHSHDSRDLLARIELFLETFLHSSDLKERFEVARTGYIAKLQKSEDSPIEAGKEIARLAFNKHGDFGVKERRLEAAKAMTFDEFYSIASDHLSPRNKRRLAVFAHGIRDPNVMEYREIRSPYDFQKQVKKWIVAPAPNRSALESTNLKNSP